MSQPNELTNRERDVVSLLLEGKSNKAIALALHITESTVEFHLKNIYNKLEVGSRTELILKLGKSVVADEEKVAEDSHTSPLAHLTMRVREAISRIGKELRVESVAHEHAGDAATPMTFIESIRTCFAKYADFAGRASRAEFWWFALFVVLVASALVALSETLGDVFLIAMLLPLLAAGTRRLRDAGKSGWWQLLLLAPVGGLVVVGFLWALPSTDLLPGDAQQASLD